MYSVSGDYLWAHSYVAAVLLCYVLSLLLHLTFSEYLQLPLICANPNVNKLIRFPSLNLWWQLRDPSDSNIE